ncbi:hypothetical protein TNCV_471531 [Trichonephila clavipes]|nr:hypothetical protein TNCV_471531 [Trichonephila clavipes]
MPPVLLCQIETHEIHRAKGQDIYAYRSTALSTIQVKVRFSSVPTSVLREWGPHSWLTSLPLPPASQEDLWLDDYLKLAHASKSLYIYKYPCLLRDSNQGQMAQQLR